ncbi:MAG TPA: hypothetical protein VFH78_02860 [Candidatus Thermoplasmatota archaeon]|nr:hypothetical protein [Candidatus Thermoplasmatota archaeon]
MARRLSDQDIARLTAEAGTGRDDERKLLAAEALRRSTELEREHHRGALPADPGAEAQRAVADRAAERIHAEERKLERASASQKVGPHLKIAHEVSLRAEEHRAHVETGIERRATQRKALSDLREHLGRGDDRD